MFSLLSPTDFATKSLSFKGFQPALPSNEGSIDRHERLATAKVAKTVGLSRATFEKGLYVSDHGNEETQKVSSAEYTVSDTSALDC